MTSAASTVPTTMTALRAHHRGGPEQLVVDTAPRPDPAPGELLVEVHAAAITFAELTWDESWTRDGLDRTPVIPSHEFSGVVVAHGADVGRSVPASAQRSTVSCRSTATGRPRSTPWCRAATSP